MFFAWKRSLSVQKSITPTRLRLELLEDRVVPAGVFITGVGSNTSPAEPFARVYDASATGDSSTVVSPPGNINAFPGFSGSVRVATGDVNNDGTDDLICAQGPGAGSGSQVRIFDGKGIQAGSANVIASFFVYSNAPGVTQTSGFDGGVFVASADFNGDGFDEVVTSPGLGANGHLKVLDFNNGGGTFLGSSPTLRSSFFAYNGFAGEIRITTLEFASGLTYLVTASGAGTSQCDVRFYDDILNVGQPGPQTFVPPALQFFPIPGYAGGLSVAAGNVDGGEDELFISTNGGGGPVLVFDVNGTFAAPTVTQLAQFTAFDGFVGEVRLGAADVDGNGFVEVLTSTGSSPGANGSHVKAWSINGANAINVRSFFAYQGYVGGVWLSTNDVTLSEQFTASDVPVDIPDNGGLFDRSTITVNPTLSNPSILTAKSVRVALNITSVTGSNNADLDVELRAPNGTQFELFSDVNGGGAGFLVGLSDVATQNIEDAPDGNPLTGFFRPEGGRSLDAAFAGIPIAGAWTLLIRDDFVNDTYRLDSWGLVFLY